MYKDPVWLKNYFLRKVENKIFRYKKRSSIKVRHCRNYQKEGSLGTGNASSVSGTSKTKKQIELKLEKIHC